MNKYKVGDKIVLTVSDVNEKAYYSYYVFNNNDLILWEPSTDKYAEPLSTYAEPLEAKIRRQAAEITRLLAENEKLKAENGNVIWEIEQAFDRGCNAAWELARKIILGQSEGGMNDEDYKGAFGSGIAEIYVIKNYTCSEAAAKVAEWEKAKEEIKVGDVVESNTGNGERIAVIDVWPSSDGLHFEGISSNKTLTIDASAKYYTKTGRHIDIGSFLKQIGGEE